MEKMLSCGHNSIFSFDWMAIKLADNQDSHKILDEFEFVTRLMRLLTSELHPLERWKKCCGHGSTFIFDRIFVKVAGNQDKHKISDEFS